MSLHVVRTTEEPLVGAAVERALREGLEGCGRVALLVPSFAQALEAQRSLAARGLALGVTVTTPSAWAQERWEVWGDGRRVVDAASREVLCSRVLAGAADRPAGSPRPSPGTSALLARLARRGLPWMLDAGAAGGVSASERALVGLLRDYRSELAAAGLVEECEVMAGLADLLHDEGAAVSPVVVAGFAEMSRAVRELVVGLAARGTVTLVSQRATTPALAGREALAGELARLAVGRGADVSESRAPAAAELVAREGELQALLASLFRADAGPCRPEGAVRVLLPAGPSARAELVAREVERLAREGASEVVVVAPDPAAAWRDLSGRLCARGVSVRAQLSVPVGGTECCRAYLELVRSVARLSELAASWPAPTPVEGGVRVALADMSWWPPRELSDFLLSEISHVDVARARALDASWRSNRLLAPAALLDQLSSERDVSPQVAAATRELMRGRLGSAASKLLSSYVQGEDAASPLAPEASAVLSAVLGVAKCLKELGLTADPSEPGAVPLAELVSVAEAALEAQPAAMRLERAVPGASCAARVMSPPAAASLAPGSVDALVLLGQTSTESAVPVADDVASALLEAYGVERRSDALRAARDAFLATLRAARRRVALERPLFGADGRPAYPSVMLTELLACYGLAADAGAEDLRAALGASSVASGSETPVGENAATTGRAPARMGSETPAPAGRIDDACRPLVSPPPEGIPAEDARPLLSASQIETYLECPYKWFSLRRLRLRDADAGFTGAEMGTFAHRVLEVTRRDLLARALERRLGAHVLEDLRAASPDATQSDEYRARVEELVALSQVVPAERVPGSAPRSPEELERARAVLEEEFDAHLSHQYQLMGRKRPRPLPQALVAHSAQQAGQLRALRRDLATLLDYEAGLFEGFEPRLFEWGFGRGGAEVEYAGVRLTGTIDRVDVDAHGQAVVIDYKHKSDAGFAREYDVFPKGGPAPGAPALPRRVQSLIYGQVVRRAFPDLTVRAAVYLCTKGRHALAGAVDENLAENVFGGRPPSASRLERICVPRAEGFGRAGEGGMEALLDSCEEAVAAAISHMLAGDIEAAPVDADACLFCPVLNCERRLGK